MAQLASPFGRYELQERIAVGGMAEIYRARFTGAAGVTKPVVIKKILPHYAGNPSFISMFIDEAKIAVGLSHGNIAQVFDFGEIDGEYFLAMEYVYGQPLSRLLKRAKSVGMPALPPPFAVLIAMEMCRGLHYAHTRLDEQGKPINLIHRDVSPPNVLVSYEGQVKIVDFGVAKTQTAGRTETEAGALKGKYLYFAPEQARGKELDARTDVFAAGVVLYEMLCGRQPFEGRMVEVLTKIVGGEFPPPRAINPDVAPSLERIVLTAMAHEKSERYPTAEAFYQALATYLHASAPSFSAPALAYLQRYLFEPELTAEGQPTELPPEFLAQLPAWKKPLAPPPSAGPDDVPTAAGRPLANRRDSPTEPSDGLVAPAAPAAPVPPLDLDFDSPPSSSSWLKVGIPLLAVALGAVAVLVLGRPGTFSVRLSSRPTGAEVIIDGQQASAVTPLVISELATGFPHRIEVRAPHMKPWSREVNGERDLVMSLLAELEPEPKAPGPSPTAPPYSPSASVPSEATYPVRSFRLEARQHAFEVPKMPSAKLKLNGGKSYRASLEAAPPIGTEVFYFLEGAGGGQRWGLLGTRPVVLKDATSIDVLVASGTAHREALKVKVVEQGSSSPMRLQVDPLRHALSLDKDHRFTLSGLKPEVAYSLEVPRPPSGSPESTDRVLCVQRPAPESARILQAGQRYRLSGTDFLSCAFPSSGPARPEGSLEVAIAPAAR